MADPEIDSPPPKRKQQARSVQTRRALIDATIKCLWTNGYSGTTIAQISKFASVTHGAHLHHFRTREELIAAAVDALFQRLVAEYSVHLSNLPSSLPERVDAVLDKLKQMALGRLFGIVSELLTAARTNEGMAAQMRQYSISQRDIQKQMFIKAFGEKALQDPEIHYFLDATFAIYLRGLANLQTTRSKTEIEYAWTKWKALISPRLLEGLQSVEG